MMIWKKLYKCLYLAVIASFLFVTTKNNVFLLKSAVLTSFENDATFSELVDSIKNEYVSGFNRKNFYINLNGLYAKVCGRREVNTVVTLENGMLGYKESGKIDNIISKAEALIQFQEYLTENQIPFLYVQAPYKLDLKDELQVEGFENYSNENADAMLEILYESGINVLDLRPYTVATSEMVQYNFYNTDHHWNSTGAFTAFQQIIEKIQELFPDELIKNEYTELDSWNAETFEDIFLGSQGKRVGSYFGGIDDITLYTPKFETEMSSYTVNHKTFKKGSFEDANVVAHYVEDAPDYFNKNNYCVYVGGDYPLYQYRNSMAMNDLKVLFLKDSFTLPVQAYLSTLFRELDVIDPRYFKECSIAEYVSYSQPDLVVLMMNPSVLYDESYFEYGVDSVKKSMFRAEECLIDNELIEIMSGDSEYTYRTVAENLTNNTKYTISVGNVSVLSGNAAGVTVSLYNRTKEQHVATRVIDIDYNNRIKSFEWTFSTPEVETDNFQLLIYAGLSGQTQGNHVDIQDVSLIEYR